MMRVDRFFLFLFLVAACTQVGLAAKHALLVGVSKYPSLPVSKWLVGPENDVVLAREVLTSPRFKFPDANITTLTGWPADKDKRPTRANIERAYAKLAKKAGKGDIVFILMSGHGSQQPANKEEGDREPDGLDEVFLPADTTTWNPVTSSIAGAIVDDEVKVWTDRIRAKGAFVWIVFDSCHSGTMTRATEGTGRVNRRIDPSLLIPKNVAKASATSRGTTGVDNQSDLSRPSSDAVGGLVAMYAAQSLEPTFELPIPQPFGPRRGLFSTTIFDVISNAPGALSYRDLSETIDVVYRSSGIFQPTPLIEGDGLDQPVLGVGTPPPPKNILFTGLTGEKGFQIDSGHLNGLTVGSILEVFPPAVSGSTKPMGTAKVTAVEATNAYVVPADFGEKKMAKKAELGAACRASVIFQELGLATMKVIVKTKSPKGDWVLLDLKAKAAAKNKFVAKLRESSLGLFELSSDDKNADWIVLVNGKDEGRLLPVCGDLVSRAEQSDKWLSIDSLASNLKKISRARQLLNIAGKGLGQGGLSLQVELVRFEPAGSSNAKLISHEGAGRVLKAGDEIAFRIRNRSRVATDVTLLHVGEDFAISAVFPEPATTDDNRIAPGGVLETPRMSVTAESSIKEQLVVLATRAERKRHDFTCLEQESLEVSRGATLQNPLGQLLSSRMYGDQTTRGLKRAETGNYATRLLTWRAIPAK